MGQLSWIHVEVLFKSQWGPPEFFQRVTSNLFCFGPALQTDHKTASSTPLTDLLFEKSSPSVSGFTTSLLSA